ncbi:CHAT domain-containing protein [uncultured Microbacterium sp.]|uniref:CHAT domain-containing protein n=1 Tax=uncultured Microbacterium sp. TaxID=191216 RepID=UPI0028DB636A|nr:CHAT domain-containing protein [uncultured Microbacterium sp.]
MPLTAAELHRRGVDAANARRFAAARRALDAAADRVHDADLRARIDGTRSYVLAQTGHPADAEQLCRDALARRGLRPDTVALLSGQLGTLLLHSGTLDAAETMLTRAIDAMSESSSTELANLLMNRSMVRMQRHELAACTADLHRAVALYERNGDDEPLAEARHNLGYAALLAGDLVAALSLMMRSRPVLAATSDLAAAISDLDRAEVLRDAGLTTEAETLLARVAEQFGAQRMPQARGEAELHLARSLLRHDPAAAERTARRAARRFTTLGSEGWAARAEAVRHEAARRAGRTPPRDEIDGTIDALTRGGFRTEATALRLDARRDGTGRMPRLAPGAATPLRLRAHEVRAARAEAAGRTTEARRAAAAGLDLLTNWQQSFGALDLQASVAMHGTDLMFAGLRAAAATGDPAVLFEWAERARHLSQQVASVRPPVDDEQAADLAELRMLRADLAGTDWTADARVRVLRGRIRERQWASTGVQGTRQRVDLETVRAHLDPDTALLAYLYTGVELLCVVVDHRGATVVRLEWGRTRTAMDGLRADLDVAALTRGGAMSGVIERSLDARLRDLGDALLAPVRAVTTARHLVITLPGVLAGVPWAMLPDMHGVPFTVAPSASRWVDDHRPTQGAGARHRRDAVPLHPADTRASAVPTATRAPRVGFAVGPRVPRGAEEVHEAATAWTSSTTLLGDEASVTGVTRLAGASDLLHIAAHGRHSADNPLFAGFDLADGTLFGYDVDLIARTPETVVLSACELGRSAVRWGEEALGMTRVWLHAGTRSVIAAPVTVPDDVACELLGALHVELAGGAVPAVALARAAISTGHRAPFQCHGSGL